MSSVDLPGITAPGRRAAVVRPPRHWADLDPDERRTAVVAAGLPQFRADQISRHYFGRDSATPQAWTDLSSDVAERVAQEWFPELLTEVRTLACDHGDTVKAVWRLTGGALVESVVMAYPQRITACVSSQAGCGIGCPFCATGQQGLTRNLSAAEIVEQVRSARVLAASGRFGGSPGARGSRGPGGPGGQGGSRDRLTNVVFMGMGEPLANYRALLTALHSIIDPTPAGFGMSARNVTVSTVGLVPRMHQLAQEGLPVTLALSLHAPDDELRDQLVPINHRWPVAEVMAAADAYASATGRRYSVEYALIRDVNDQPERATALGEVLAGRLTHLNVIPLNPTPGSPWTAADPHVEQQFVSIVRSAGVAVTVRDTRGREIDGACGQLAAATAGGSS
ncbi:MAG: 23S rRNA (adenine(2503)-C(2))-methyltransferase RlmN [Candidatus Nanopelagicales bacterium]